MKSILWYNKPAKDWNDALAIGNGILGAMVFGGVDCDELQLNEETLWSGFSKNAENPELKAHLPELQQLIFEKKYAKAQELCGKYLVCGDEGSHTTLVNGHYGSYQTAGELYIEKAHGETASYRRQLDIENGIASTEFDGEKREYFASYKYNVIAVKITGNTDGLKLRYERNDPNAPSDIKYIDNNTITVTGSHHDGKGENYAVVIRKIDTDFGCVIYSTIATDYVDKSSPLDRCLKTIDAAANADIDEMMNEHKAYFRKYMDRADIALISDDRESIPTNERLLAPEGDLGLVSLYFQFGRYLLVSSSRGVLPANLQGIWCKDYIAPWNSDYHININIQMNYWPAEITNLSEFADQFFNYIKLLSEWGKRTADETYGCRGWVAHTVTNPWGFTAPGEAPSWGAFMCAGAWCCRHIWEHYLFTEDKEFLKEYYPVIKGSAEFFEDFLVRDPNTGWMVTCPSNSPENSFFDPNTHEEVAMSPGPTMDNSILYDLFTMVKDCSDILGIDSEFAGKMIELRDQLPPLRIGKYGQLMEWIEDFDEVEPGHRHVSNLYALHPSDRITCTKTPELFAASAKTLERRLSNGGGHTGWSRAWIINFYARLREGNKSGENVEAILKKSTQSNMFDSHPPFQIDGNFGATAGIAEMLIQSHEGFVNILPALPDSWKNGSFKGLMARGGFEVSCEWKEGIVTKLTVKSVYGNKLDILANNKHFVLDTEKDKEYKLI